MLCPQSHCCTSMQGLWRIGHNANTRQTPTRCFPSRAQSAVQVMDLSLHQAIVLRARTDTREKGVTCRQLPQGCVCCAGGDAAAAPGERPGGAKAVPAAHGRLQEDAAAAAARSRLSARGLARPAVHRHGQSCCPRVSKPACCRSR